MKVWITCFILLFGAMEVLQWLKQVSLPLPIFILGGAFLAVASNYDKLTHLPFHLDYEKPDALEKEASTLPLTERPLQNAPQPVRSLHQQDDSTRPISFTIRKPHQPGN